MKNLKQREGLYFIESFLNSNLLRMGSFILRLQRLRYLPIRLSKVEAQHLCWNFQRNVHINRILASNVTRQFIIHDLRASGQASKNSDFGKIVDLECDFDKLKVDDDYSEGTKIKKSRMDRKYIKKGKRFNIEEAAELELEKQETEIDSHLESKSENDVKKQNFKILKDHCNTFRKAVTTLKTKKLRDKRREILLEGKRLIQDALSAGHLPLHIFFSRFSDLRILNLPENVEVIQVPYKTLNLWSDVVTSQGVIGVFEMPELRASYTRSNIIPLIVICDNVRDPGNLGAIIRIVAAVGGQELILTTGCVDMWDLKVLRAGAGAHFRLPIANNFSWEDIENTIPEGMQIILADNEVPRVSSDFPEDAHAGSGFFKNSGGLASNLPLHCYTSLRYEEGVVIVLGGETYGLSHEAYQFAKNRKGSRVYIPMGNSTESLNNAVSLGIISYEIRRQLSFLIDEETSQEIPDKNDSADEKS